ncbi:GNAT family N-acetyltransferase [Delftia acidovorans]|uniref:GNAT family N-acetyltransferase n=1 Tax=Delftia acidovorans TaxID=80866 RepID=UPI001144F071|nr:GNAT family N-acetyltransferase [Delftia acidovorans]
MIFYEDDRVTDVGLDRTIWLNINGSGPSKIRCFSSYCVGSAMAVKRLSQASSTPRCHVIYACANGVPIGYCAVAFLDEKYDDEVAFAIDYVYICEIYRGKGYSRFIANEVVRLIDDYAKKKKIINLFDYSEIVSVGGAAFSFMRTTELRNLDYCVTLRE